MGKYYRIGIIMLFESLMMILFYGPNERIIIFWVIMIFFIIINSAFVLSMHYYNDQRKIIGEINLTTFIYSIVTVLTLLYSIFQFNYVFMPYQYFESDVFWSNYEYKEFHDDVRIEYYTRDYLEYGEVYKESYDKDEIKEFIDFFKDVEILADSAYEDLGYPDIFMDWYDDDIHVMIRNMDFDDEDSGHYIFSIDILGDSNYVKYNIDGTIVQIYEVPEGLREFVILHLLEE